MTPLRLGLGGAISIALALSASAQTIPFQLLVTQGQNSMTVQNGAPVTFLAPGGGSQTAQITATYNGTGQITISQKPEVFGSTAFTASIGSPLPVTLNPGNRVSIDVTFSPTSASQSTAQLAVPYTETISPGTTNTNTITLGLVGTEPAFVLSYVLQTSPSVVPLVPGGTIPFPPTLVGTTAQAALNITNTGSGSGSITGIAISPGAFVLENGSLLPATVPAGQTLTMLVLFQPTTAGPATAQVTITFSSGPSATVNLTGTGTSPSLTYQLLNTTPPTTVSPGGTITLPSANLGQTTSVTVRAINSGNANATVSSINLTGPGQVYTLSSIPPLPQTLTPGASINFTVNFTPTQPGTITGTLSVNSDTFTLSGVGLGSLLTFSYPAGGNTITLGGTNNSVVFSPVAIGQSEQINLDVKNTGTLPATISNIGIQPTGSPFTLSGLPSLPVTLAPNADFPVTITFTPTALGFANANLILDTTTIGLVGSGTQPPPLPAYTISGPSGNVAPMTQPMIGLTLASPYPLAISGTLTLGITGTLPADQAVQFITGGNTVSFTIPANQTSAVFGAQGTQLGVQTGTVASTVTITPSFETQAGNVPLTPATPTVLQFSIAPAAPELIAVQITGESTTGFTIQVTGFTTTRTLISLVVQFGLASGFSMPTSQFTFNVQSIANVWFQSATSKTYGSQFTITIPFTFQGTVPVGKSVLNAISSVSVTATNEVGTSNSVQVPIP